MSVQIKLTNNIPAVDLKIHAARRKALAAAGNAILELSNSRTPRDTGALIESGKVLLDVDAGADVAVISYSEFYAVWQHEKTWYHHPNGGQAKFLESAVVDGAESAYALIASTIAAGLT